MENKSVLLTYYSATIRETDLGYLEEGVLLNDAIISFWLEYLSHALELPAGMAILDPGVVCSFPYC